MSDYEEFRAKLAGQSDEEIQEGLDRGDFTGPHERKRCIAQSCLDQRKLERQVGMHERQESREAETLELARRADKHANQANELANQANELSVEANKHADEASRTARFAAATAVVAIIVSAAVSVFVGVVM
jgi:hypothetical protein